MYNIRDATDKEKKKLSNIEYVQIKKSNVHLLYLYDTSSL